MNNNSRIVLSVIAGLFAISLIVRFVVLSQAGLSGMWIFYLGLPIGGVVTVLLLLLRLGLLNFGDGQGATVQHWQHNTIAQPPQSSPSWATPSTLRLQELDDLRASGSISDTEYAEKRAGIISSI
jgi:hypothetical protein